MVRLSGISKSYGQQSVLKDFSLEIRAGDRVAVMGHSGAGKTTLLRLICGLTKPDSGEIFNDAGNIGTVFQEDRLVGQMSALRNCEIVKKKGSTAHPSELLKAMGIDGGLELKPVSELSGGEKRRAAIARALIAQPELLILDEPFKGIDTDTLPRVIRLIDECAKDSTVILVTHSKEEAERMGCTRYVELRHDSV